MKISAAQCRAARALLDWSRADLAKASKVSVRALASFESGQRQPYDRTLADVIKALREAGVEFLGGARPGVRMKAGD